MLCLLIFNAIIAIDKFGLLTEYRVSRYHSTYPPVV
jgi:hypothetical protein